MRLLILIHRYLGMLIGLVIVLWCLSGFVMMYVQYPEYTHTEQLADLERLELGGCCSIPDDLGGDLELVTASIESLLGKPVLIVTTRSADWAIDLATSRTVTEIGAEFARASVDHHADGVPSYFGQIDRDQWTVAGGYNRHRPLHHFAINDAVATELYVSDSTGQVVLKTTGRERFWNWLGAVIHWIYPTQLRSDVQAWSQVVIWLSIAGTFLTLTGLYVGIARFRSRKRSPYRDWFLWHHYLGLIFGLFTLTWIVSGLLSMTPFGAFSGRDFSAERNRIQGGQLSLNQIFLNLSQFDTNLIPAGTVRLTASMFGGDFAWISWTSTGDSARLGKATIRDRLSAHAGNIRPQMPINSMDVINEADAYYYSHHDERDFPVFRIVYEDGERLYLDLVSGELIRAVDSDRRWSRWFFHGLHRGDFAAWARQRPIWDVFMLFLMAGVTAGSLTGAYVGCKRTMRWFTSNRIVE